MAMVEVSSGENGKGGELALALDENGTERELGAGLRVLLSSEKIVTMAHMQSEGRAGACTRRGGAAVLLGGATTRR